MKSEVKKCTCQNEYQDNKYGKGMRVHNPVKQKTSGPKQYRCTVCGDVKS